MVLFHIHNSLNINALLSRNELAIRLNGNFGAIQTEFSNYAVGQVVLTKYNNKHYKIDDIDWSQNPKNTFMKKTGETVKD